MDKFVIFICEYASKNIYKTEEETNNFKFNWISVNWIRKLRLGWPIRYTDSVSGILFSSAVNESICESE